MKALNHKLVRECWHLKGQLFSIALVVATGVMTVITMRGSYESLVAAQMSYYHQTRFADVWVSLRRAPNTLRDQLASLPGVALADTRISLLANLDIEGLDAPARARMVSLPESGRPILNDLILRNGRWPATGAPDEIIISEKFAAARRLLPGDTIKAIINGRSQQLDIVGIAISPEHSFSVPPGSLLPEDDRYGVLWMNEQALGPAYDMAGAFNEAYVTLAPDADELAVLSRINSLLQPYGGLGAYPRADQASHLMLQGELDQNRVMGTAIPIIFLSVAVFLLHLVLGRLIATQRGEIAVLKAFGYHDAEVGMHFLLFAIIAGGSGALLGTAGGVALGEAYIDIYRQYFDLPELSYRLSPRLLMTAVILSLGGAITGALGAAHKAAALPPAEAMRPEPPASFQPGLLERVGLGRLLPASGRMILRNLERKPMQAFFSALGVAFSVAILLIGLFMFDGIERLMDLQFREIQREDVSVSFQQNVAASVAHDLSRLPGVRRVETYRFAPVRLHNGHLQTETAIQGMAGDGQLRRIISKRAKPFPLPASGLVISSVLARELRLEPGDQVRVELLEGKRQTRNIVLAGIIEDYLGLSAYMEKEALAELSGEKAVISGAWLAVDANAIEALYRNLKQIPLVAGISSPASMLATFETEMAQNIFVSVAFIVGFASVIAIGVIYNGARIALSERGRELASLRVMGFHRNEVAVLLLGEQAVITLLAIPLGWLIGYFIALALVNSLGTDMFRIPFVISARSYLFSAGVTLVAATASGILVRRRLDAIDLVSVLKTRE
ncbi:MAG: FtsX-like permease family protein [Pseudomonadales bacterium]|nr:FtsX-like permease family protein [Pseudomonadales bacterium]